MHGHGGKDGKGQTRQDWGTKGIQSRPLHCPDRYLPLTRERERERETFFMAPGTDPTATINTGVEWMEPWTVQLQPVT